ncbi:MAG: multidrug effflux MFS transporter [Loktanella sp.]|nr:multidrug effflux MFS transporter [Loktanella sp.]
MTTAPTVRLFDRTTPPHILTLILLAGISALSMSIFLPSLTAMAAEFGTPYATMQLAVTAYLATTAVIQIAIGPLSDRYGRRLVTLFSLGFFVLATIGTVFAQDATTFLVFRILQAAVASGMVLSRAIVRDMVPAEQAASMIGYVTMGMALVPMVGPTIGGILDQFFGWRASFVFLGLAGAGVFTLAYLDQGETLQSGGMGFRDQLASYPALLTSPRFWGYALCTMFGSGAFFAFLGGASFVADKIYGLTPFQSGIALGAPAIGYALGNFFAGRYSTRIGIDRMALYGAIVASTGLGASLLISLVGYNTAVLFFAFCTFLGLGNGMLLPNATAGLLSVKPHLAGTASGLGGALMIGGGAILSQYAGSLLSVESGAVPLQWVMLLSSIASAVAVLFVMFRKRTLGLA